MVQQILISFAASATPIILLWVLYLRKHKAEAVSTEKTNDRTEIDNIKLIAQEWRESAIKWKDLADEYQMKFIEQNRKMEAYFANGGDNKKEIERLNRKLTAAYKRIKDLEDQLKQQNNGNK